MGVEILILVTGVLALVAWVWFVRDTVEQAHREQQEEPFGSKRWHWPAAAFLGVSFLALMLLVADSG
jgi:uncharacterized BrkB/YihY/UPF0761 family membrane protein